MFFVFCFFDNLFTIIYSILQPSLLSISRKAFLHVDALSGFNRLQAAAFHGDYDTLWEASNNCCGSFVQEMNLQKTGSQAKVFPGKTALEILLALQDKGEGNVEIEELYKGHVEKFNTLTELHLCRDNNDVEKAVEIVLNEDVDINIPGKSNRTPLLWASVSASGEFIKTLIDLGADVNAQRTDDKFAPLCLAADWNNYVAVDILLKHGADVGHLNISKTVGLHSCAENGFLSVSRLLIDSGCDINLRKNTGQTALYFAVKNKHKFIVKFLLESEADVNMKYNENASDRIYLVRGKDRGKPVWHYVLVEKALLPLFLRRTKGGSLDVADFGLILTSGWGKDPPENVRKNINEMGATFPDTQSQTVLHVASKSASLEIVDLLINYKADVNANDMDGFTPLHLAAMHGNIQVVKKLVETNADVNLKVGGKDAADLARMNEETEIEEYLKPKRSLPQRDSESQSEESQSAESRSAESPSVLTVAIKGAGQGLKYLEHGLKFLEEKFN